MLLQILVAMAALGAASAQQEPKCKKPCGNLTIEYPFGYEGCNYNSAFLVTCNETSGEPIPILGDGTTDIIVKNMSIDRGELEIMMFVGRSCYNSSGYTGGIDASLTLGSLEEIRVSAKNRFVAIGCDTLGAFRGTRGKMIDVTGCYSACSRNSLFINGSCSGVGCCEAAVPEGISSFNITLISINDHKNITDFNPCSYGFFLKDGGFNFSTNDLRDLQSSRMPMLLDWAIGNLTWETASGDANSFLCKGNSVYNQDYTGPGYRCLCREGFEGNPYIANDCKKCTPNDMLDHLCSTDINECTKGNHDCLHQCKDIEGSYDCKCRKGYSGDGRKGGSGCSADQSMVIKMSIGFSAAAIFLIVFVNWLYFGLKKRKLMLLREKFFRQNGGMMLQQRMSRDKGSQDQAKVFTIEELKKATNNYDESRIIGKGGYGTVYKGILSDNRAVAIKKSKLVDQNQTQIEQFINEVIILSQINHRNVVKLIGCCLETEVPSLVYEFIPNGTVSDHLHNKSKSSAITWDIRLRIAHGTAEALSYLHSAASIPIIHRDVKPANILLDESYVAKVADFGASRLIPTDQVEVATMVQGTLGYLDPEYLQTQQLTDKSDVYSFGVVLVELLTGKNVLNFERPEGERNQANHFLSSLKEGRVFQVLDEQLQQSEDHHEIITVSRLAERCLHVKGDERPTMKEVAMELEGILASKIQKHPWVQHSLNEDEEQSFLEEPTIVYEFSNEVNAGSSTFDSMSKQTILPIASGSRYQLKRWIKQSLNAIELNNTSGTLLTGIFHLWHRYDHLPQSPHKITNTQKATMRLQILVVAVAMAALGAASAQDESYCSKPCGNVTVEYPFGYMGCNYTSSFLVTCNQSTSGEPTLFFGQPTSNLVISNMTTDKGELEIMMFVASACYNSSGLSTGRTHATFRLGNVGRDIWVSNKNKFVAIGYDTDAYFRGIRGERIDVIGCDSGCGKKSLFTNGSCDGVGCCEVAVPDGISAFNITVRSRNNHNNITDFNPCSYAFFHRGGNFNFSTNYLGGFPNEKMPMLLEWAIGNLSCETARKEANTFQCKGKSDCDQSYTGPGYRCLCLEGFKGNPYVADGCQNINECRNNMHDCLHGCEDTTGDYTCKCPNGYSGDGRRRGTGCRANQSMVIKIAVGSSAAAIFLIVFVNWMYFGLKKRKHMMLREKFFQQNGGIMLQQRMSRDKGSQDQAKVFTIEELKKATNNYDESRIIGKGGYGTVYKGVLSDNRAVAIKKSKIADQNETQIEQFINEVIILSQINHRNVVKLIGCCLESEVPSLVYEFIPNGTVSDHLHNKSKSSAITWDIRLRIAHGTAEALSYLHSAASIPIIHRDVKPTNILLDESYVAKVADFGASRLIPTDQIEVATMVQGTLGYLDPEYLQTQQLTDKHWRIFIGAGGGCGPPKNNFSDVYSFGVVLVELLTGKNVLNFERLEGERNQANHFLSSLKEGRVFQVIDEQLQQSEDHHEIITVSRLAERCLHVKGDERPTMKEVAMELEGILALKIQKHPWVQYNLNENEEESFLKAPTIVYEFSNGVNAGSSTFDNMSKHSILPIASGRMEYVKRKLFRQNGGIMSQQRISRDKGSQDQAKVFTIDELKKAINNYDESSIIARVAMAQFIKGAVAIKKCKLVDQNQTQIEQFINEVIILSQINPRNVVNLIGCCLETEVPSLVYEFIPNGTVSDHLHNKSKSSAITWDIRLRIAHGTAEALSYLHSAASIPIIQRDVKPTNILLDESYTQQLTDKSDVYSFGVVLVELLTGKNVLNFERPKGERNQANHFLSSLKEGRVFQVLDEQLQQNEDHNEIITVSRLAERCLHVKGDERPTMKEVAMELEGILASKIQKHPWVQHSLNEDEEQSFLEEPTIVYEFSNEVNAGSSTFDSMSKQTILPIASGSVMNHDRRGRSMSSIP
ncbi:hypothetical protein LXL04_022421 [Taraxacum kok-saghyz]